MEMLLMLVVFVGAAYFLMIRPQPKRMSVHQSQIDALQPGDRVILKQVIARVAKNDEEEFEFTDEVEETAGGEESTENVDGVDASAPEDTAATEEPVSEKH